MKRSGWIRSDPAKVRAWQDRSRTRLPAVSARRAAERLERDDVKARAMARDGGCVLRSASRQRYVLLEAMRDGCDSWTCPPIECCGPADGHEVQGRGVRPGGHLDIDNVVTLCRAHHDWCHAHVPEARAMGLKASVGQ